MANRFITPQKNFEFCFGKRERLQKKQLNYFKTFYTYFFKFL